MLSAATIRRVLELRDEGLSQRAAARQLRAEGYHVSRASVQRFFRGYTHARPLPDNEPQAEDLVQEHTCPTCGYKINTRECLICRARAYEGPWVSPPVAEDVDPEDLDPDELLGLDLPEDPDTQQRYRQSRRLAEARRIAARELPDHG